VEDANDIIKEFEVEKEDLEIPLKRSDRAYRERLIVDHLPQVKRIALHIHNRLPSSIALDDLVSTGVLGLMDAVEKYDPSRGKSFRRYLELRVRGAIIDELRSYDVLSRSNRKRANRIEDAARAIEAENGRPPTEEELSERLACSIDELHELLNETQQYVFLDLEDFQQNIGEDRARNYYYSSEEHSEPFQRLEQESIIEQLTTVLRELPEKLYLVLSLYYYSELNYKEIGQVLDLSESRISQLHKQAVDKLRKLLQGRDV